jgi:predicted glycoside hydrolase/deacetylase ChbG (UPF0249 family)
VKKQLIVNADDYGRSPSVSAGIRQAHQYGIVTSTTVMTNFPGAAEAIQVAVDECPSLGIGVHLCLTSGRPILSPEHIPSLVGPDGNFVPQYPPPDFFEKLDPTEAKHEFRAQIEAAILAGATLSHLDSHHHSIYRHPALLSVAAELADEHQLGMRMPLPPESFDDSEQVMRMESVQALTATVHHPDNFITTFYDDSATLEQLLSILDELPPGLSELMCHPGYTGPALDSVYNVQREREIEILCHPAVKEKIAELEIELVNFDIMWD